jgi:5-deoxy-glucuronate isomerase
LIVKHDQKFIEGYNAITSVDNQQNRTFMDFGQLILSRNKTYSDGEKKEKAYLLVKGKVTFEWDGNKVEANRNSCFDENPCCLQVPSNVGIKVTSLSDSAEISVIKTYNDKYFPAKFYSQEECVSVEAGKGEWGDASRRIIRTVFDLTNAPDSNLVLGEVVHKPGCWSSYPPHHHPQPELYFYKFMPEQGFGYSELGGQVFKVKNNDACIITDDVIHPQVAAPGYSMFYIWTIRHLENNLWNKTRIYAPEHRWLTQG